MQPLRVHWALIVQSTVLLERPTERPVVTNGDHWMTKRIHQKCCVCWKIAERSLKDWWDCWVLSESSQSIHWKSASLKDQCWETILNWMETMASIVFTERSLRNHGRPWRSLSAHWKTVERSVKFCGRSMVSQRSRLCGKGVLCLCATWPCTPAGYNNNINYNFVNESSTRTAFIRGIVNNAFDVTSMASTVMLRTNITEECP